ncbi:hypothetical protein, partial [Microbacterium sp. SD291]|uniref:hypothetical protein n=1 Tax=Microbacterium sp. SD291 TaxID=2782007 RepID=UPI001A96E72F
MTAEDHGYRRVLRRETHASRTVAAVVVASVITLLLLATAAVAVWLLVDVSAREEVGSRFAAAQPRGWDDVTLIVVGSIAVVLALLLIGLALLPGRRARRARIADRLALLIDDGVLADAVADAVAGDVGTAPWQVSATMARRAVIVRITPTSGVPVDRAVAAGAATDVLSGIGFPAAPRVIVSPRGVVA